MGRGGERRRKRFSGPVILTGMRGGGGSLVGEETRQAFRLLEVIINRIGRGEPVENRKGKESDSCCFSF